MARQFTIPETTIVIQPEITGEGTEVNVISVTDDGGCVMASWNFAGKSYNQTLWDENTTPTYAAIGVWTDELVNERVTTIINQ
jgi:hypothetical protein